METRVRTTERVLTRSLLEKVLPRIGDLSVEEEVVLRMRYGITVEASQPLTWRGNGNEELEIRLALMEKAIMEELDLQRSSVPASSSDDMQDL